MNERETVAQSLNRFLPLALCGPATDDVLAALGLGEGGANVVMPREITLDMQYAYFNVIDANMTLVETDARLDRFDNQRIAYRAMLSARPQAGEAGE